MRELQSLRKLLVAPYETGTAIVPAPDGTGDSAIRAAGTHIPNGNACLVRASVAVFLFLLAVLAEALPVQAQRTVPTAPQSVSATSLNTQVRLRWAGPRDHGGFDLLRYEVRHAQGESVPDNAPWTPVPVSLGTTRRTHAVTYIVHLPINVLHTFEVRAVNTHGAGPAVEIQVTPGVPVAPLYLSATAGNRQVTLEWQAPTVNGGSAVLRYEVRRALGRTVTDPLWGPLDSCWPHGSGCDAILNRRWPQWIPVGLATTHTVRNLSDGKLHTFEVRAVNARGAGPAARVRATPLATVPTAPRDVSATPGDGMVTVTMEPPEDDGGSFAHLEWRHGKLSGRGLHENVPWVWAAFFRRTGMTVPLRFLHNGRPYLIEMRAVNDRGAGPVVRVLAIPGMPTPLRDVRLTPGNRQVTQTWKAPVANGGFALSHYEVRHGQGSSLVNVPWKSVGLATEHTVTDLVSETLYAFEVRPVNTRGPGVTSHRKWRTGKAAPAAPQTVSATSRNAQVTLRWAGPRDHGGFELLRYEVRHAQGGTVPENVSWTPVGLATTYTVHNLAGSNPYTFEVRAVNARGAGPAVEIQVTPGVPTVPRYLSATSGIGQATLSWAGPQDDGSSELLGYEVRHAQGFSIPRTVEWTSVGLATTHTVGNLAEGRLHAFDVRAVNAGGGGLAARIYSHTRGSTPGMVPSAPRNVSATPGDGVVTVTMAPPADEGSSRAHPEWRYSRGTTVPENVPWKQGLMFGDGVSTAEARSLDNGTPYAVEVRAANAQGPGPVVQVRAIPGQPTTLRDVYLTGRDRQVTLRWKAPVENGGFALSHYEVRHAQGRSVPENVPWKSVGLATTHTVNNLASETRYAFEVRPVNTRGPGVTSHRRWRTGKAAPTAPQSVSATSRNAQVTLRWAEPRDHGGFELLRYEVRHAQGGSVPENVAWTPVGLGRWETVTHAFRNLPNGAPYTFEVRAVNAHAAGPAAEVQAIPGLPAAPWNLSSTPGNGQVTLRWGAAANSGSEVLRYEMRYAQGGTFPENAAWTPVGLVTMYTVRNLPNGAPHTFAVRAVNARGAGPAAKTRATPPESVPAAPRHLSATPSDGQVNLRWAGPRDDGGSEVLGYQVRHAQGGSVPENAAWTSVKPTTTHTVTNLSHGGQVTPNWRTSMGYGGSTLVRGNVRHAGGGAGTSVDLVTTHTVSSVDNGTLHTFEVRAVNARGAGPAVEVQATTPIPGVAVSVTDDETASAVVALAVSPPSVDEDAGATMIEVTGTLDGAPRTSDTTVRVTVSGGTASAGDFAAVPDFTLTIPSGDRSGTASFTLTPVDDGLDEPRETIVVGGTSPGLEVTDAVVRIVNIDSVPRAWLAHFGRTVAEHVLQATNNRMAARRAAGVEVRLAGQQIGNAATAADEALTRPDVWQATQPNPYDSPRRRNDSMTRGGFEWRPVTGHDLLTNSSFSFTEGTQESGLVSVWGHGAMTRFDGRQDTVSLDGEVISGLLGMDWTRGDATAGLILSHSQSEGGYRKTSNGRSASSTVTGLYPWGLYELNDRLSVRGVAGYGVGRLSLSAEGQATSRTDLDLMMVSAGLRGLLLRAQETDGLELAFKIDGLHVRTNTASAPGIAAGKADVTLLRLGLEGSRPFRFGGGATLTPSLEIGVRHDSGDAETGFGADIGGGFRWVNPASGISADLTGRGLLTHESNGFRDHGIAGSLGWNPDPASDRGPSLTLSQTVGASATGGMDALIEPVSPAGLATNDNDRGPRDRRLELKMGYGFSAFDDRFTSTPEIGLGLVNGQPEYSLGWRLKLANRGPTSLELRLEGTRREHAKKNAAPNHAVGFHLGARF